MLQCVNPLLIGELISTVPTYVAIAQGRRLVSIPFSSGNSFLPKLAIFLLVLFLCQSPSHRGTHFYARPNIKSSGFSGLCQSPSHRGTHFYDYEGNTEIQGSVMCQSPSHRGTHFYGELCPLIWGWGVVSIPFSSGNSFLRSGE